LRVDGSLIPAPGAIAVVGAAAIGVRRGTRANEAGAKNIQPTQAETEPIVDKEPAKIRAKKITRKLK